MSTRCRHDTGKDLYACIKPIGHPSGHNAELASSRVLDELENLDEEIADLQAELRARTDREPLLSPWQAACLSYLAGRLIGRLAGGR